MRLFQKSSFIRGSLEHRVLVPRRTTLLVEQAVLKPLHYVRPPSEGLVVTMVYLIRVDIFPIRVALVPSLFQ